MKSKYAQMFEKSKSISENNGNSNNNGKYLTFFQPKKELDKGVDDKLQIRILPGGDLFYEEYQKHMFKTPNGQYKIATCLDTIKSNGTKFSDESCPICKFLKDNGQDMSKESRKMLYPQSSFIILIYNKYADEIQKYEVTNYGMLEILGALNTLGDDFDPDVNGFDIYINYETSSNGKRYIKVSGASKPKETIDEIMERSKNFKKMRKVLDEAYPELNYAKNNAVSVLTIFVESYEPTYTSMLDSYKLNTTKKKDEADSFNFGNNIKDDVSDILNEDSHEEIIKDDVSVNTDDDDETLSELRSLMDLDS